MTVRVELHRAFIDPIVTASGGGYGAARCPRCHGHWAPKRDEKTGELGALVGLRFVRLSAAELAALVDGICPRCASPEDIDLRAVPKARIEHELKWCRDRAAAQALIAAHLEWVHERIDAGDPPKRIAEQLLGKEAQHG